MWVPNQRHPSKKSEVRQDTVIAGSLPSYGRDDETPLSRCRVVLVKPTNPDAVSQGKVVVPSHVVLEFAVNRGGPLLL